MEICGNENLLLKRKIKMIKLQISTKQASLDQDQLSGHGHSRTDIARFYRKVPDGNVKYTEFFEVVNSYVHNMQFTGITPEAREKFLLRYSNLVVLSGQSGIGKSTCIRNLVREMWESSLFYPDVTFFIQFRDIDYETRTDLLSFLDPDAETTFPDQNDRMKILKSLEQSENVYIIMDGLDEAHIDFNMQPLKYINLYSFGKAEFFIQNLLAGNILPRSKKLISSRPLAIAQLPNDFQPKVLLTLQGLNDKGIKQVCRDICDGDRVVSQKVLGFLENQPDMKSSCYSPLLCITTIELLREMYVSALKSKSEMLEPTSSPENWKYTMTTALLFAAVALIQKIKQEFSFRSILSLAFNKLNNGEFHFGAFNLHEAGIDFQTASTFLNTLVGAAGTTQYYFVHITWQEFLVSAKLRLYTTKEELIAILRNVSMLDNERYYMVAKFLFGLCNNHTLEYLLNCIEGETEINNETDRKECKQILIDFAIEKLHKANDKFSADTEENHDDNEHTVALAADDDNDDDGDDDDDNDDGDDCFSYFRTILPILEWAWEMQDDDFTKQVANCLNNEIKIFRDPIFLSDIISFNYVLRERDTALALRIHTPHFIGNCFQYFIEELQTSLDQQQNIQVRRIVFHVSVLKYM